MSSTISSQQRYHRVETPTQTPAIAQAQVASGEIWGAPARSGGGFPCVKAYRNHLPANRRGIEFITPALPTKGSGTPYEARWYYDGITPDVTQNNLGYAVISATVIKNTQVP